MTDEDILDDEVEATPAPARPARPVPKDASFVDRAWVAQDKVNAKWQGLGRGRIARVLRMARKPEPEEFRQSAFVVLVGIAIIGAMGFFIYLGMSWLIRTITPV